MEQGWIIWTSVLLLIFVVFPLAFPYRWLKLIVFILRYTCYNARANGLERIPEHGPAMLVANHVSIFDSLILMGLTKRHVHFLMHHEFYRMPVLHHLFRRIGVIEVPPSEHPKALSDFFAQVRSILRKGHIVCVFPEGGVSGNGLICRFKSGIAKMLPEDINVPVLPVRVGMLWGSVFSFYSGRLRFTPPRQFPIPLSVSVGRPVSHDMTPYQLRQLISEMGAEAELDPFPRERPVHYAFARWARWRPWHVAFKDFGSKTKAPSGFAMLVRALVISKLIRQLDEPRSKYIGILMPNTTATAALLLGTLFADRVPAMLNFTAGEKAREHAIKKAKLKVILTSRKFLEKLKMEPTPEMVILEDVIGKVTPAMKRKAFLDALLLPTSLLMRKYSPESRTDLQGDVVLLFSSGSTGLPKGIMLTHHNVNSNFFSYWRIINWTPADGLVGNLPFFHAFGFMVGFVLPSIIGTPVTYITNPLDAQGICNLCEQEKPTIMVATPTFLQHYMHKMKPGQFASLRLVVTGAEKLRADISDKFKEKTGLSIVEGFGCTELSPIVAINLSYSVFELGRKAGMPGSIGAALPGIHVKIVDPNTGETLPPNTPGLMLVKGALVMRGYLDDKEATDRVIDKNGYYNTGDVASMSPDGYLTITGRLARFSKIAGEMVPHELVEMAINEILQSEERCVAVCGCRDPRRGERLVVFYSTDKLVPEEMVEKLHQRGMPNLWVPKATDFVRLESIPMLGAGKIDLQKLVREECSKLEAGA